jgi:hypothetical protein
MKQVEEFLRILFRSILTDAMIDSPPLWHNEDGLMAIFSKVPLPAATAVFPRNAIVSQKVIQHYRKAQGRSGGQHTCPKD